MVFCKISENAKGKLERAELRAEKIKERTKKKVNTDIGKALQKIEQRQKTLQFKIAEKRKQLTAKITEPYKKNRNRKKAMMFLIDVCLITVLGLLLYKLFPLIKKKLTEKKYTNEQLRAARQLPESAYTREQLIKAEEIRQSFIDWETHYKSESGLDDDNVGRPDIVRANQLRQPMIFFIQYIMPYLIVAYVIWFIIKYIRYVIAAIWGFFVTVYQFVTKKITCKLAEKWYIRMVTGWEECDPGFGEYLDRWKNNYIIAPARTERLSYLRAVEQAKQGYRRRVGRTGFFEQWRRKYKSLRAKYIEAPAGELYQRVGDFHSKTKGDPYPSVTPSGKVCKCPPRKTVYKRLTNFIKGAPEIAEKPKKVLDDAKKKTISIFDKSKKKLASMGENMSETVTCDTLEEKADNLKKTSKMVTLVIWIVLLVLTIIILGLMYYFGAPTWIKKLYAPVTVVGRSFNPQTVARFGTVLFSMGYVALLSWLGYYSFS
jgi:hypothetical protein